MHFKTATSLWFVYRESPLPRQATHTGASLYATFPPAEAKRILDRIEIHYTPKHASWLNMAEIEIGIMNRQCLNRRIDDIDVTTNAIAALGNRNVTIPARKSIGHFRSRRHGEK